MHKRLISQPVTETGWRWHILADLDGSGFCVLPPPARVLARSRARPGDGLRMIAAFG
jgi:hypothetical protein